MGEVTSEVQEGIELVRKAGGTFEEIREAVSNVAGQTQEVSASIEQMAAGVEQINVSMKTIMEVTENASLLEQRKSVQHQKNNCLRCRRLLRRPMIFHPWQKSYSSH